MNHQPATTSSRLRLAFVAAVLAVIATAAMGQTNLLTNGDFEAGTFEATVTNGTALPVFNWTFNTTSGSSYFGIINTSTTGVTSTINGTTVLALNSAETTIGVLYAEQTFNTVSGQTYTVSFETGHQGPGMATNAGVTAQVYDGTIASEGSLLGSLTNAQSTPGGGWGDSGSFGTRSFTFMATGSQSTIRLLDAMSGGGNSVDSAVDNVSVVASAVPEPATYAAMAGAAMLGFAVYRRRQAAKVAPVTTA